MGELGHLVDGEVFGYFSDNFDRIPGFFQDFPGHRFLRGLFWVEASAGNDPYRDVPPFDEEDLSAVLGKHNSKYSLLFHCKKSVGETSLYSSPKPNFADMKKILLGSFLLLSACNKYHVAVIRQNVNVDYLASSRANTPDPRKANPPLGQILVVDWHIPTDILHSSPSGKLHVVYKDYSEEVIDFDVGATTGYITHRLLGEKFLEKGGFLTYKAEILTASGEVYREWKQQLWVRIIHLDQGANENSLEGTSPEEKLLEKEEWIESSKSSVEDQSRQGSVTEMPYDTPEDGF